MADESTLRRKARRAIQGGKLPERFPDRTWGGPGAGDDCTICGAPIERDELELEIEFGKDGGFARDRHHVHIRCFAAWEFELRQQKRNGEALASGDRPRSAKPAAGGREPPESDPAATVSRRVLLPTAVEGKMDGRGGDRTYRRGSG